MLWLLWLIFALLFLVLAYHHWRASKNTFPRLKLPEIPLWELSPGAIRVNTGIRDEDMKAAFSNLEQGINSYIDNYNKTSARQNVAQAIGYVLASLTAIVSMFLT